MTDLRQLVKEEMVKNIIDKLIFGLIAAMIVFGAQQCSAKSQREQIEREAILRLDSQFVLNEAQVFQDTFSDYIAVVTESISLALPPTQENQKQLLVLKVKVESSVEVLSVYRPQIKSESAEIIAQIERLNNELRYFKSEKIEQYQNYLNTLKSQYGSLLRIIKISAIDSLNE